jgi:hypothetical protein
MGQQPRSIATIDAEEKSPNPVTALSFSLFPVFKHPKQSKPVPVYNFAPPKRYSLQYQIVEDRGYSHPYVVPSSPYSINCLDWKGLSAYVRVSYSI